MKYLIAAIVAFYLFGVVVMAGNAQTPPPAGTPFPPKPTVTATAAPPAAPKATATVAAAPKAVAPAKTGNLGPAEANAPAPTASVTPDQINAWAAAIGALTLAVAGLLTMIAVKGLPLLRDLIDALKGNTTATVISAAAADANTRDRGLQAAATTAAVAAIPDKVAAAVAAVVPPAPPA